MFDFLKKQSKQKLSIAGGVLLVLAVILGSVVAGCYNAASNPSVKIADVDTDSIYIRVEPGMSGRDIGDLLLEKGVITSKFSFWLNSKISGADDKFKVGLFCMQPNMAVSDALDILINGKVSSAKFTIPEGYSVPQIAKRLSDAGLANEAEFLKLARSYAPYDYMEKNKDADYVAEGFLFPDTYEVSTDCSAEEIMQMMVEDFDNRLTDEMRAQAAARNMSIYELVTLASLVEKEARYDEDRPIIAQVFLKRLAIDMPLQSDTTLTYLIGAKEDVTIADTKVESPYNTYQNYGLPPGPIACPGMAAIEAVLHPADTDYLYFVADRDGHNHYSMTYDEHLDIVDKVR